MRIRPTKIFSTMAMATALWLSSFGQTLALEPKDKTITGKQLTIAFDPSEPGYVCVNQGKNLLLRYRYQGSSHKGYVKELTAPGIGNILRDAPADHLHHHGLMFAVRVNGVNFWEETPASGKESHKGWKSLRLVQQDNGEAAELHEHLDWQDKDGKSLMKEERLITVYAERPGQPRLLTWKATFTPSNGTVAWTGTNYNGLGMRFVQAMDQGGRHRNSHKASGVDATKSKQASWCAYTAEPVPGKPVTVAMFDSPANPRHPGRWFTMTKPFAYLSASLGLDTTPLTVAKDQPLTLVYGVAVFAGDVSHDAIESVYGRWKALAGGTKNR